MTGPEFTLRMIQGRERESVASLLAEAWQHDPVAGWLVPEDGMRKTIFRGYCRILADFALEHGIVYGTPDLTGAAMWIEALQGVKQIDDLDNRTHAVCGDWADRFRTWHERIRRARPRKPHWYLMSVAVRPGFQGKGLGSALLRHHHLGLDEHRLPAYLEATGLDNHGLFVQHGYQNLIEPQELPGNGPLLYPMWREPQRS